MTASGGFQDHFSGHSADYARYRPQYPEPLFDFLVGCCECRHQAWDCATGNGQSALSLVKYFNQVVATDASAAQIDNATAAAGITYRVAPAEQSGLDGDSVDLLTVAQALHWFDLPRFFAEAARVVRSGGVVAAWSYRMCSVDAAVDEPLHELYSEIVDEFWPPERDIVDRAYVDIEFPAPLLDVPEFEMSSAWSVDDMLGYLRTWSATKRYERQIGVDPVAIVEPRLRSAWGDTTRTAVWPLHVSAYRVVD